jgi:hypothetical protein
MPAPENKALGWSAVTGDKHVASPGNMGAGAPQGVSGDSRALLDGSLLQKLKSHIKATGGSYSAGRGHRRTAALRSLSAPIGGR